MGIYDLEDQKNLEDVQYILYNKPSTESRFLQFIRHTANSRQQLFSLLSSANVIFGKLVCLVPFTQRLISIVLPVTIF